MDIRIRRMEEADVDGVSLLADRLVGSSYYTPDLVREYRRRSSAGHDVFSYVAETTDGELVAFRFVLPAGRWSGGRGKGLSPERWPADLSDTAYFQSCFVDDRCMGKGIGRRLAWQAMDDLKRAGTRAVVAHSWKESPHGSSLRYLTRLGFQPVAEHLEYWKEVDYVCRRCGEPCLCTAIEVVMDLEAWEPPPEMERIP
ncbi:MAG: GNAT family N-acetyltransferase [Myxococcota bacterium]|nr:GNAT family N-acetyltransferase [Myxococcota bacterium]